MSRLVLLTGIHGYVGRGLLPLLTGAGFRVRCLASWTDELARQVPDGVEVVRGDLNDEAVLARALIGVDGAYYLRPGATEAGRRAAERFGVASRAAGVRRLVCFAGFGAEPADNSQRPDGIVEALESSGVPTVALRASVIIGAGSLAFEMTRALAERMSVIPAPRWMRVPMRPIFIGDLLGYLIESLDIPLDGSRAFDVGGSDVVSLAGLIEAYAHVRGIRRLVVPLPAQAPGLSRLCLRMVTPQYARVAGLAIEGLSRAPSPGERPSPTPFTLRPMGVREALIRALQVEDAGLSRERWSQAVPTADAVRRWGGVRYGNRLVDTRVAAVRAAPHAAFAAVERIGGARGWHSSPWLWALRGWMDAALGGPGMRRGRRDPECLEAGDAVDCWRVEALERGRLIVFAAEMKLPGRGWLEFEVHAGLDGDSATLRQTALFDPLGLAGLVYWLLCWPFHQLVFAQMIRGIAREAERGATAIDRDAALSTKVM
jgi:uncharacterized protein YbjT (DUF2867 family)